ncbi:MAG TPA: hypothetical protein VFT22_00495, partial [Kofleriaceae bacterium]|nr:hypothetical protein [Kofleriaceae bacterium]
MEDSSAVGGPTVERDGSSVPDLVQREPLAPPGPSGASPPPAPPSSPPGSQRPPAPPAPPGSSDPPGRPRSRVDRAAEKAALDCLRHGQREQALKILMTVYGEPLTGFAIRVLRDREL